MAKIKYFYNTDTCSYEKVTTSPKDRLLNIFSFLMVAVVMAIGIIVIANQFFMSPKEAYLNDSIHKKLFYLDLYKKRLTEISTNLRDLARKDDNIYRIIFEADPIPSTVRNAGVGGSERYQSIINNNLFHEDLLLGMYKDVDKLKRQMYIQSKSYDDILKMAGEREKLLAAIPAIQPLEKSKCRLSSGFGMRYHPIHKYKRMHDGIDFGAKLGTPIYATADGVIAFTKTNYSGYGKQIEIDHGYGYRTKYAHMHKFNVKRGQKVKRGDCIGFVGNTGTSTSAHLHYEVMKNGKKINPVHYFFHDLNENEYNEILELASIENTSMGM